MEKVEGRQTVLTKEVNPEASVKIESLTAGQVSHLNKFKFASYAVFRGARLFCLYVESALLQLDFHAALKSFYEPPSHKIIEGHILDECFNETFLEAIHNYLAYQSMDPPTNLLGLHIMMWNKDFCYGHLNMAWKSY
jgi:hypothetical protein